MTGFWNRIGVLLTGNVTWIDQRTGQDSVTEKLDFKDRWSIFGVHSYNWWWVRTYGKRDCGCTFNPLTRRQVLFRYGCPLHSVFGPVRKG